MRFAVAVLLACCWTSPALAFVDLHAHPFMDDGLGSLFRGRFEEETLRARDWSAKLESQINVRTLQDSELRLVVASIYVHPLINAPRRKRVRSQIDRAELFVKEHPEWVLARTPGQAREARARGKRVLVLALEGASGILESEEDLREFIDERGIRIVTLLHLTDDHLGGAAFFSGFKGLLLQPISWVAQAFSSRRDGTGARLNSNGLDEDGSELVRKLLARRVWIDLAHSSDESQRALIPILKQAGQPLLYTHTVLRRFNPIERALSDQQLEEVRATGGIVGLMPSESMLEGTPASCDDGLHRLAEQAKQVAARAGAASTLVGSDFNGGVTHLPPPRCPSGTDFDAEGLWHIGQTGRLWRALEKLGVPQPREKEGFVTAFLDAWARASKAR